MFTFEKNTTQPEERDQGPLPHKWVPYAWFIWCGVLLGPIYLVTNSAIHTVYLSTTALVLARLATIDMAYFLLLNIYTLPLIPLGVLYHALFTDISMLESGLGALIAGSLGLAVAFIAYRLKGVEAFGMGDVKLMAALGAWVGVADLSLAFALAFTFNLIMSLFIAKNKPIPFGVGLVVGLWVFTTLKAPFLEILFTIFT